MCDIKQRTSKRSLAIRHREGKKRNQMDEGDKEKEKNVKTEIRLSERNNLETSGIIKQSECLNGKRKKCVGTRKSLKQAS